MFCYNRKYVFEKNYELLPIANLKKHIDLNKHLLEIPSEKDVLENGINVGDLNGKLLEKIEELTLYMIEQNERIKQLEEQIKQVK